MKYSVMLSCYEKMNNNRNINRINYLQIEGTTVFVLVCGILPFCVYHFDLMCLNNLPLNGILCCSSFICIICILKYFYLS